MEHRSKPPFRTAGTHSQNVNALKFLRPAFGEVLLQEITPEAIEEYLEERLTAQRRVHTRFGTQLRGRLKPATVHQEFRILRRILNVAVQKRKLASNPCQAVEFPVSVKQSTRKPHYMTASEQERIEFWAPPYVRTAVVILVETGLRPYKELFPMRKDQIDLNSGVVHIPDSKTTNGIADIPLTEQATAALTAQIASVPDSEFLYPALSERSSKPYLQSIKKVCTPGRIRTCDLLLRRQALYPAELQFSTCPSGRPIKHIGIESA